MGRRKTAVFWELILIFCASGGFGADFGVVVKTEPEYGSGSENFTLTGSVNPWVSALFSPAFNLYVSAGAYAEYTEQSLPFSREGFPLLIELERLELNWRPVPTVSFQLGRQQYGDPAGLIMAGLFDGLHGSWGFERLRFSLGALYTGLLYKKTANIAMTAHDLESYAAGTDYRDMTSYFASKRILVPVMVEFSDLSPRSSLALSVIAQFDMNRSDIEDDEAPLHSQYLEIQYLIEPREPLHITFAASAGLVEYGKPQMGFAAMVGADYEPPQAVKDLLSFQMRWSSGRMDSFFAPFFPVSNIAVGEIFTPRLTGLMQLKAAYSIRPHTNFSAEAGAGYFIRTDLETLQDANLDPALDSRFLGGELYCSLIWAPQSTLRLTAGGGAFFPGLGGAFASDTGIRWKASLGLMVSL
ncbi:hypothetical protein [Treponema primitia]|nr:hypothetical protein [Treponema primitia]